MSHVKESAFDRYVGIDYSGAQTPTSSLHSFHSPGSGSRLRTNSDPIASFHTHASSLFSIRCGFSVERVRFEQSPVNSEVFSINR